MDLFHHWFEATPSIYPPNRYDIVEWKNGKQVRRDHNKIVPITSEDYRKYKAVDAKYCMVLFEFVPMGNRMEALGETGGYLLKTKKLDAPWSFGSCNACWKEGRRNFTDTTKTMHPFIAKFNDPNLSVLGGCGCVICNGCVTEMEKYSEEKVRCTACPYCGYPTSFPKDLRMWCVTEQVQLSYRTKVMKDSMKVKVEEMKKAVEEQGVTVKTMHLSAEGEISYTMEANERSPTKGDDK